MISNPASYGQEVQNIAPLPEAPPGTATAWPFSENLTSSGQPWLGTGSTYTSLSSLDAITDSNLHRLPDDAHAALYPGLENPTSCELDRTERNTCQKIFTDAVHKARSLSRDQVCTDSEKNQDALIRGVLEGWNNIAHHSAYICPLWAILHELDRRVFCLSGIMTRLCTLKMIHSLLLVRDPHLC